MKQVSEIRKEHKTVITVFSKFLTAIPKKSIQEGRLDTGLKPIPVLRFS